MPLWLAHGQRGYFLYCLDSSSSNDNFLLQRASISLLGLFWMLPPMSNMDLLDHALTTSSTTSSPVFRALYQDDREK